MQAVILAGGMGTRLRTVSGDLPKPLVPVAGRPLLDRQLEQLKLGGIRHVLLLTGYASDQIETFCGDGSQWGLHIRCIRESTALGTAGAVMQASESLADRFLTIYGDTVFDVDIDRMIAFHESRPAEVTLFVHPNDHPFDSDLVELDAEDRVLKFHPYPHAPGVDLPNLVNAGIYIIEKSALSRCSAINDLPLRPDFGKHVFPLLLRHGKRIFGYRSPEYVKDAGTSERLERTSRDLLSGRVAGDSLRTGTPAVLLDRDGTILEECGYISRPEEVKLLPDAGSALARLNRSLYRTVLITNQPVIARGECNEAGMRQIHNRLEMLLGTEHAYFDRIYCCPHHPDAGFPGERADLKVICDCRKPAIGMVKRAARDLNLNLNQSWIVGDSTADILTANRTGIRSILVQTGEAGRDGKWPCLPDFTCRNLAEAVDLILDRWPRLSSRVRELALSIKPNSVVLVGGLARSGKSTFAAILAAVMREQGSPAIVVPLDCWLKGADQNRGATVLDRYDISAAAAFLRDALLNPGIKRLPRYDRMHRRAIRDDVEIQVPADAMVILEGVPALANPELRAMAAHCFYIKRREEDRLCDMSADYQWRGWSEIQIAELFASRLADEVPLIENTSQFADTILDTSSGTLQVDRN